MLRFRQRGGIPGDRFEGTDAVISRLLRSRGVDTEEKARRFLHPDLGQLYDPFLMQDMDRAVHLIRDTIAQGGAIAVYGDYDTDGVCATSVMMTLLRRLGARADFRIPSRHSEGYGLNAEAVRELAEGHALLITVDCGVTNHEEVRLAKELGMRVLVTDHHQLPDTPVEADAILNPLRGDYPFRRLCGAGVALKVCQAMLGMDMVMEVIDLAALATVADVVPLIDENRVIVTFGMREMDRGKRPGIRAMMESARCARPMTSSQVAFRLAPRINAGGRLEEAAPCVRLLLSEDEREAQEIAQHLEENNRLRQDMQGKIIALATEQMKDHVDFYDDRAIIVMGEGWNTGVIGLAAGRLCETYHMPAIVLTRNGDKAVGSCRSIPGVNIHAMLNRCSDLFVRFGGHEQAAGLTMDPSLVPELRRRLNLLIRENCDDECFVPFEDYDLPLHMGEVTLEMIESLGAMEPTGFGNPPCVFLGKDLSVQRAQSVGRDGAHLRVSFLEGGEVRDGIAFGMGEMASRPMDRVDVLFTPEKNEYLGRVTPQLQVKAISGARGAAAVPSENRLSPYFLQELRALSSNDEAIPCPAGTEVIARTRALGLGRGTLFIAHRAAQARAFAAEKEVDVAVGSVTDPRPFPTLLLCPDPGQLRDRWKHIVLLDGDILPGEAAAIRAACPRAEVLALRDSGCLEALRREAQALDLAALRNMYRRLRGAAPVDGQALRALMEAEGLNLMQLLIGLEAFQQARLAEWTLQPFSVALLPPSGGDPARTPIMRYLFALGNHVS